MSDCVIVYIRRPEIAHGSCLTRPSADPAFCPVVQAGMDVDHDEVRIVESLPSNSETHSLDGLRALRENLADGFWGNGMRLALAEKAGITKLHLELRRGDGPPDARHCNFAALTVTEKLIEREPEVAAAAVRAIVATQKALKAEPALAKKVGDELFPGDEADMIPWSAGMRRSMTRRLRLRPSKA